MRLIWLIWWLFVMANLAFVIVGLVNGWTWGLAANGIALGFLIGAGLHRIRNRPRP